MAPAAGPLPAPLPSALTSCGCPHTPLVLGAPLSDILGPGPAKAPHAPLTGCPAQESLAAPRRVPAPQLRTGAHPAAADSPDAIELPAQPVGIVQHVGGRQERSGTDPGGPRAAAAGKQDCAPEQSLAAHPDPGPCPAPLPPRPAATPSLQRLGTARQRRT